MQMMQDMLGVAGISRTGHAAGNEPKRKRSLSSWDRFKTVSWRADAQKDFDEHTTVVLQEESWYGKARHQSLSWLIPASVGVLTACSGAFIEKNVEWFGDMRVGYCPEFPYIWKTEENCGEGQWVKYSLDGPTSAYGFLVFVIFSTAIATLSATLTWAFAPFSMGSGMPEVKTILGGFTFPGVLAGNTLVIKIIGLSMSVGSGLSCGKEGPLVHIACCWSNLLTKFFVRYRENEAKQRELLSCACAAGVAVAFGAPLGGVLFSLEEASTIFPTRTMLRAFFAATMAAVTLAAWNPTNAKNHQLTMFSQAYNDPPQWIEYPFIIVLGIVGGCIGATFVHYNIMVTTYRSPGTWWRNRVHIVLEVSLIAVITAITSYHLLWTRVLSNVTIRALFHSCDDPLAVASPHKFMLDLCMPNPLAGALPAFVHRCDLELAAFILLCGGLRLVQMAFTFGSGVAAGLFIPSLYAGASLGRVTGMAMWSINEQYHFIGAAGEGDTFINGVYPGMYAMLGAAAVLGGVCRVTISLVVIMFELTSGLQLVVPFMIVCTLAKWVGDQFTIGIYDYLIVIRKYPFLHEPDEVTYHTKAHDLMDEAIDCLHPECGTLGQLMEFLKVAEHGGYPLTQSPSDPTFLGYIHTAELLRHLEMQQKQNGFLSLHTEVQFAKYMQREKSESALDLSKYVDETVMTAVSATPAVQLQNIFRNLGVGLIVIKNKGDLVGIVTKKSFITYMEELHHHDTVQSREEGGLRQALLPTNRPGRII